MSERSVAVLLLVWLGVVACGMGALWSYANAPGVPAVAPVHWPQGVSFQREANRPTLVMLAHPRCPCTRASLRELARILSHAPKPVNAHVLFYAPDTMKTGWERTDLWEFAASLPGVEVHRDENGIDIRRFGGATSGQVLVFGSDETLRFSGGITAARGHEGDNVGGTLARRALAGSLTELGDVAVFGCPILDPECGSCCDKEGCSK